MDKNKKTDATKQWGDGGGGLADDNLRSQHGVVSAVTFYGANQGNKDA